MQQMSFDFGNSIEYGELQENIILHKLNRTLHGKVVSVGTTRDVKAFRTLVNVKLRNGISHAVDLAELFSDETLATLILLGAADG